MPNNPISNSFHYVNWPVDNVLAFTTTRRHPDKNSSSVSYEEYDDFNLGLHVGDDPLEVEQNRKSLKAFVGKEKSIQYLEQVHGSDVVTVNEFSDQPYIADAAISRTPDIALAVMTADCLPILLTNKQGTEIAAIHGGWRPLASNIIANTIENMNSEPEHIIAWLGPCIGPKHFEVGVEVKNEFGERFEQAFKAQESGKLLAGLQQIASIQLRELDISSISTLPHCTYSLSEQYYSYRRDQVTGRMVSVICIR